MPIASPNRLISGRAARPLALPAPAPARQLRALVVLRNPVLQRYAGELRELGMAVEKADCGYSAMQVLCRERLDFLICEATSDAEGQDLLEFLGQSQAVPLTVLIGETGCNYGLQEQGKGIVVLRQPLHSGQLAAAVRAHWQSLLEEKREGKRIRVEVPITLMMGPAQYLAVTTDLAETGVGVRSPHPLKLKEIVELSFALPGSQQNIRARGEVCRVDDWGNAGIHVFSMSLQARTEVAAWLESRRRAND